jgi:putative ABC transport system permease protein
MDSVRQEIRYALRGMRRRPGFTAVALATLALAIGANTAIFSVVNQLLIRPLPYRDADRLVVIAATRQYEGMARPGHVSWHVDDAERWRGSLRAFAEVTFYSTSVVQFSTRNGAELLESAAVEPSFFSAVGGPIVAGRPLDAASALTPAVVISDRLARRLFDGPTSAIGAHLVLNSADVAVVGVAGAEWDLPSPRTDVWQSSAFAHLRNPRCCDVELLGRLKDGVTMAQARGDVASAAEMLEASDPKTFRGLHTTVTTLRNVQLGNGRTALQLLWAAVGIVLLVACANVVNLLVARNIGRTRELSIRHALGASRGRLLAQGMIEAGLLAAGAVAVGLGIARAAVAALARIDPDALRGLRGLHIDVVVFAFAVALGVMATVLTGILPSMRAARVTPPRTVTNAPTRRDRRVQHVLCIVQLCAAVVLVAAATLLGRSLVDLLGVDLGVTPDHVLTASINTAFGRPHSADEIAGTMLRVIDRVEAIGGVQAVGAGTSLPPDTSRLMMTLKRKGDEVDYAASAVSCTPGYFQALGIRLLKGRFFAASDDPLHSPVIILSATTARHLFGTDDPIGQTFAVPKFSYRRGSGQDATVVGVVSDVKYSGIDAIAGDQVYWPLAQAPWLSAFLAIRTTGDVNVAPELRRAVSSVDPTVAVSSIRPLASIISGATAPARFRTFLVGAFAVVGLGIASIGLYGVVAYSVSQRTVEIGVRVALGAATSDVLSLVLREGMAIAALGLLIGLPAAYATTRAFASLLFGVKPGDAVTYAASAATLMVVAVAATYPTARRAARLDPTAALRSE